MEEQELNGMALGAGMLFIGLPGSEEFVMLGEVAEGGLLEAVEDHDAYAIKQIITDLHETAEFTVNVPKRQMDKLLIEVFGIRKMVLDMVGGRVAHLARHGRKHKIRKKNLHRAFRLCENREE